MMCELLQRHYERTRRQKIEYRRTHLSKINSTSHYADRDEETLENRHDVYRIKALKTPSKPVYLREDEEEHRENYCPGEGLVELHLSTDFCTLLEHLRYTLCTEDTLCTKRTAQSAAAKGVDLK